MESGHTLYTLVTAPVATVALLDADDADVAEGLSLLTYLGLRTADNKKKLQEKQGHIHSIYAKQSMLLLLQVVINQIFQIDLWPMKFSTVGTRIHHPFGTLIKFNIQIK